MIYLDSSAVVKIIQSEPESYDLSSWLSAQLETPRVSSSLVEIEVPRALARTGPVDLGLLARVMAAIVRLDIDTTVRRVAATLEPPVLRSLDAIHLATALEVRAELTAFVGYDKRLQSAAATAGLPAISPGV